MEHFEVVELVPIHLGPLDISFTNAAAMMVLSVMAVMGVSFFCVRGKSVVPGRAQSVLEIACECVSGAICSSINGSGMCFFPLVFSVFSFILAANVLGMFPWFFAVTSQLTVTFAIALLVISTVVLSGLRRHGFGFFNVLLPGGVPSAVAPLVCLIELFAFLARPISLSVRLFANILAGHIALDVFSGFVVALSALGSAGLIGSVLPLGVSVALTGLELLVAFLQAYVFMILTCMYLNDAVHPKH